MKTCTKCGKEKTLEEFGKLRNSRAAHCLECDRKKQADYRERNKEKERVRRQKQYQAKKNGTLKKRVPQSKANAWREANPEKGNFLSKRNKHKRRSSLPGRGTYTSYEWEALKKKHLYHCVCCDKITTLTVDHIVPLSKGGMNEISNLQPLCLSCNSRKRDRTIEYAYWHLVSA